MAFPDQLQISLTRSITGNGPLITVPYILLGQDNLEGITPAKRQDFPVIVVMQKQVNDGISIPFADKCFKGRIVHPLNPIELVALQVGSSGALFTSNNMSYKTRDSDLHLRVVTHPEWILRFAVNVA